MRSFGPAWSRGDFIYGQYLGDAYYFWRNAILSLSFCVLSLVLLMPRLFAYCNACSTALPRATFCQVSCLLAHFGGYRGFGSLYSIYAARYFLFWGLSCGLGSSRRTCLVLISGRASLTW